MGSGCVLLCSEGPDEFTGFTDLFTRAAETEDEALEQQRHKDEIRNVQLVVFLFCFFKADSLANA